MPKINPTTSTRTRYLRALLQVACLMKIIKPHRKLQWPIKLPVACDQNLSLGQDVLFDKPGPHGGIGFSLATLRFNRTYYISSP